MEKNSIRRGVAKKNRRGRADFYYCEGFFFRFLRTNKMSFSMVEEKKKQGPDLSRCGLCTVQ